MGFTELKIQVLRYRFYILLVALAVFAVYFVVRSWPDETDKVKKQFAALAELVSKETEESFIAAARRSQKIGELFTDPCEIHSVPHSVSRSYSRRELAQLSARFRNELSKVRLKIDVKKIEFSQEDPNKATALLVATMRGDLTNGDPFAENLAVLARLEKPDKKWLIHEIRVVEGLEMSELKKLSAEIPR